MSRKRSITPACGFFCCSIDPVYSVVFFLLSFPAFDLTGLITTYFQISGYTYSTSFNELFELFLKQKTSCFSNVRIFCFCIHLWIHKCNYIWNMITSCSCTFLVHMFHLGKIDLTGSRDKDWPPFPPLCTFYHPLMHIVQSWPRPADPIAREPLQEEYGLKIV